jgi:phage shock protein PspC (stress-responsive transcriptional regulator)
MNKTVNINLGGIFFHIDEDAYQKLTRYFEAIKRSLSNSTGQDEIIKDIEMRIAELVGEKHSHDKQVITLKELDEIIAVMGQPEDYRIESDEAEAPAFEYPPVRRTKKLYRDPEKGMLGGVCAGLGYYFGMDPVWLRIIFVVLAFASLGLGVIPYIVLWIVMPAAVTTAEKLEMMGEPVTISNIEKKVREEAQQLAERYGKVNYDKAGKQVRTGFERAAGGIGAVLGSIFRVFAKILGAFIVVFSALTLVGLLIGIFTLGSTSLIDVPWQPYLESFNYTTIPMWFVGLTIFCAVGIPFFFLFLLGLKLISSTVRSIGNGAKYTLVAIWALSIAGLIIYTLKQASEVAFDNKEVIKQPLNLNAGDTLKIKFRYDDFYAKDLYHHHNYLFTVDQNDAEVIYSNNVAIHVKYTDEPVGYIQIEKQAHGKSVNEARQRAKDISYGFTVEGNQIVLDNYFTIPKANKVRDQEVEIFVYLPKGVLFRPDSSLRYFDYSDNWFFNLHESGEYTYLVKPDKVYCLNCPAEENDYEDVILSIDGIQIKDSVINVGDIRIETTAEKSTRIELGPDGTLIKQ